MATNESQAYYLTWHEWHEVMDKVWTNAQQHGYRAMFKADGITITKIHENALCQFLAFELRQRREELKEIESGMTTNPKPESVE